MNRALSLVVLSIFAAASVRAAAVTGVAGKAAAPQPAPRFDQGKLAVPAAPVSEDVKALIEESPLPFHMPRFDKLKDEAFGPAFEKAMADQLAEIQKVADEPAAPTFENTIVAMERTGLELTRLQNVFSNLVQMDTNPKREALDAELAPKLAAQADAIYLNAKLFARVRALYDQRAQLKLDRESEYLLERYYKDFTHAGALLSEADKAKLKELNKQDAAAETLFKQNLLKESNASAVLVDDKAQLDGLPADDVAAAAAAAKAAGHDGKWLIALQNTTGQPALTYLKDRALRERIQQASEARGSRGGEFDNRKATLDIVRLRAERAKLLGYPNHAAYVLDDETAGTTERVNGLLNQLDPAASAAAKRDQAEMQKLIDTEAKPFPLQSWDWAYYAEKVRQQKYAFDESQLRPYFELDRVVNDGVFYAAHQLYGLTFKERHDLPVYEPEVRVWEVFDKDGRSMALFIGDYYARDNKHGGAWMNEYVSQSKLLGLKPVVANQLNIPKPPAGQPTLLTPDEVVTAFHEFGHALHGMLSSVEYPRFAGTNTLTDFVEFPSQVNEMWAFEPEVLKHYAKHYQTGKTIPQALVDKVIAAEKFNKGFTEGEVLEAAALDQAWHQLAPDNIPTSVGAFEADALLKYGFDLPAVPSRYHSAYFYHSFANGYSARYYSYIWDDVLVADSIQWFKKHGGLKRANGDHFRGTLLSRGGSSDAVGLFKDFTGGEPDVKPLLTRWGFDTPAPAPAKVTKQ